MNANTPFTLRSVNAGVHSVHTIEGDHVGNLKLIGGVWKFKAVGYDANGKVIPGGGPLTNRHNTRFSAPDEVHVSALLGSP